MAAVELPMGIADTSEPWTDAVKKYAKVRGSRRVEGFVTDHGAKFRFVRDDKVQVRRRFRLLGTVPNQPTPEEYFRARGRVPA
jgi:hypothetical protein